MKLLDRLPIYEAPSPIEVRGEVLEVYRNQIVVWISLAESSPPFPSILGTRHSHHFSIARRHLERWAAVDLEKIGESKVGGRLVPQYAGELFLHANETGTRRLSGRKPLLEMSEGSSVVPDDIFLRLPLLGLRALIRNNLDLILRGKKRRSR